MINLWHFVIPLLTIAALFVQLGHCLECYTCQLTGPRDLCMNIQSGRPAVRECLKIDGPNCVTLRFNSNISHDIVNYLYKEPYELVILGCASSGYCDTLGEQRILLYQKMGLNLLSCNLCKYKLCNGPVLLESHYLKANSLLIITVISFYLV